jgi:serine/threonine protein kinase
MRVKHRDIKPSNILIKEGAVYFTDFGISKIVPEGLTTGTNGPFGPMTRAYVAPEALRDDALRGRAADVFSLGCVFLEMGIALIGPPGSRERFRRFREEKTGTVAYAENTLIILQWIWHLWGYWSAIVKPTPRPEDRFARHGVALPDLAFLMLDPNPDHRITSRQLVALISTPKLYYFGSVNAASCNGCRISLGSKDNNLPLHSEFKEVDDLEYPETAEQALEVLVAPDWDAAKRKWLKYHMWW